MEGLYPVRFVIFVCGCLMCQVAWLVERLYTRGIFSLECQKYVFVSALRTIKRTFRIVAMCSRRLLDMWLSLISQVVVGPSNSLLLTTLTTRVQKIKLFKIL